MLFLLIILCSITQVISQINVNPVFFLDLDNYSPETVKQYYGVPTLIEKTDFMNFLKEIKRLNLTTVIFVENDLCNEYISSSDSKGLAFSHLERTLVQNTHLKTKIASFIAYVQDAFEAITEVFPFARSKTFSETDLQLSTFDRVVLPYYYVHFQDSNRNKIANWRRHDNLMFDVYEYIRTRRSVIGLYTGKICSVTHNSFTMTTTLKPTQTQKPQSSDSGFYKSDDVWIELGDIQRITFAGDKQYLPLTKTVAGQTNVNRSARRIQTNVSVADMWVSFNFKYDDNKWYLEPVTLIEEDEEVGRTKVGISARLGHSFACWEPIKIHNCRDRSTVYINKYKMEMVARKVKLMEDGEDADTEQTEEEPPGPKTTFAPSETCANLFSTPILTALLLIFLWLSVLFYGICSLMAIKSNDRYDDPLGKMLDITEH